MRYYSEKTDKFYNTEADCLAAEEEFSSKEKRQEEARQRIKELREAYLAAYDKYKKALEEYCEKYGTYTFKTSTKNPFDLLFKF